MIPKILEYLDGRIKITAEAFIIKELNDIIQKHGDDAEPYLAYVHLMTCPDSPYAYLPNEEMSDSIIFDITQTLGVFDEEDELIQPAIDRLSKQWESRTKRYYDSICIGMDKVAKHLENIEVVSGGKDSNLSEVNKMIKEAGATFRSYKELEKQLDEEIEKIKMRGKSSLGDY